jgi:HlyD family secretion protein
MKKLLKFLVLAAILGAVGYGVMATRGKSDDGPQWKLIAVERGTIVDKALATGQVVPEQEISVKSQISGTVKEVFVKVGDTVRASEPMFRILPDPTPTQINDAERQTELAEVAHTLASAEFERRKALFDQGILAQDVLDAARQTYDKSRIELELARERLELLKEGRLQKAKGVDSILRAPASGTVLERDVDPGDPVVPLTSFQEGTALATLADMDGLIFKGTVDEIDVGKLEVGLPVRFKIGALPNADVRGRLTLIAPKATEEEGATLFDVEAAIEETGGVTLRAGYSTNAEIIIEERADVLLLPERLVTFDEDKTFVELPPMDPEGEPSRQEIVIGLSDGLHVEVVSGLDDGTEVVQRPPKEIG